MGIEDTALAVRECKVVLWRQDIQNNSTGNIITDPGSNCGKQSIRKRKTVVILGFTWWIFLCGEGSLKILIKRFNCCHGVISLYGEEGVYPG